MTAETTAQLRDTKVDVKVVLCGLWIAMLFVFAYVDIFAFWRAGVFAIGFLSTCASKKTWSCAWISVGRPGVCKVASHVFRRA